MSTRGSGTAARVQRWSCWIVGLLLTGLALVASPSPAGAHGGFQIAAGTSGPYGIVVRARPFREAGRSYVDVTSYVVRQSIGEPDLTTNLRVRLRGPDGIRELRPRVVGDGYEAIIAVDDASAWRFWTVEATVRGTDGIATVRGGPLGDPPGAPGWLPWGTGALLLAAVAGWVIARRRAPSSEEGVDDWDAHAGSVASGEGSRHTG